MISNNHVKQAIINYLLKYTTLCINLKNCVEICMLSQILVFISTNILVKRPRCRLLIHIIKVNNVKKNYYHQSLEIFHIEN